MWQHFTFWLLASLTLSNWLNWLWCKWLVAWRMIVVPLFWCLWNLGFAIGWQPICCLLCECLCNTFILYIISCMRCASNNGELPTITTTMMGSMWSMIFLRELKGLSKGYHFFVPTYVCWSVFYLWWIPMPKSQDGNPFWFHDFGMFHMFFLSTHNFFLTLYHDFRFCITLL